MAPPNRFDRLRWVRRLTGPVEAWEARRFGRTGLSVLFRTPVLVLHTTGRRSGVERSTVLAVHEDDDGSLLVVGGAGGQARTPDWVANLRASSGAAAVTFRRRRIEVAARELMGEERSSTWAQLARTWPRIETYQRRAAHEIPVFRFVPVEP